MFYLFLIALAILCTVFGFMQSWDWHRAGAPTKDWGPEEEQALFTGAVSPSPEKEVMSDLVGCKPGQDGIRCALRSYIYERARGQRWMAEYPTVRALDRAVTFAADCLLTSAPPQAQGKWGHAIDHLVDNISMSYDATKTIPTLDQIEAIATASWQEGCAH